jgi:hypothetical protein
VNQSIVSNVDLEALKGDVECAERGQLKLPSNGTLEVVLSAVQATYDQVPGGRSSLARSNRSSVIVSHNYSTELVPSNHEEQPARLMCLETAQIDGLQQLLMTVWQGCRKGRSQPSGGINDLDELTLLPPLLSIHAPRCC